MVGSTSMSMEETLQARAVVIGLSLFVLSGLGNNIVYIFILLPSLFFWIKCRTKLSIDGYVWAVYLLYVLMSNIWSNDDIFGFFDQLRYLVYIAIFLHGLEIYRKSRLSVNYILFGMLFFVLMIEMVSIISYVNAHGLDVWMTRFPRIYGKIGIESPIDLSCILVLIVIALMSINNIKPLYYILILFCVAILIAPFQTRISLLGLAAGVLFVLFQKKHYRTLSISVAVILVVVSFYYFEVDRFSSGRYPRLDIWMFAFNKVVDDCSVFYGCGFNHEFDINVSGRSYAQLHSLVLSQFFYGGMVGIVGFLVVIIRTLWIMFKINCPWLPVLVSSLVVLMTNRHEIISNPNFVWVMLWMPIGLSGLLFKREIVGSTVFKNDRS